MPLAEQDKQLLRSLSVHLRDVRSGQDIVVDADRPGEINLITSGFACRYKQLKGGNRQILGFLIAGEVCDLRPFLMGRMDHSVSALGRCQVAVVPYSRVFGLIEKAPRMTIALWRETMVDAAICYEWLTGVGRRSAYARMSHLFCEIWFRMTAAGLAHDHSYDFPVTQTDLGDALGLSVVHVNRTLQELRADGLITFHSHVVTLVNWSRLQEAAEFDTAYLAVPSFGPA